MQNRIRIRPARITPGVHPGGALRLPVMLRKPLGRFGTLARIAKFSRRVIRVLGMDDVCIELRAAQDG